MKIYLAGPMSGIPHFNFPAFFAAAKRLEAEGHIVFNPAAADIAEFGQGFETAILMGDDEWAAKEIGLTADQLRRNVFRRDTEWICLEAEGMAFLPGWEKGRGARMEWNLARCLDLEMIYLDGEGAL